MKRTPARAQLATLAALAAILALAGNAQAATYRVNGGVSANSGGGNGSLAQYDKSADAATADSVAAAQSNATTAYSGSAGSAAGPGGLHAVAIAQTGQSQDGGPLPAQTSALAFASMSFSDFVVGGGAPGSFTQTSINAHLDGLFEGLNSFSALSHSQVSVVFLVDGVNIGGGFQVLTSSATGSTLTSGGSLVGWNASGDITSPTFHVTVGQPFRVELQLAAVADAQGIQSDLFSSRAVSDFDHTLTFATAGPVFNLAAGLRLDSAEAGIANNLLAVPEAPSLQLFAAGALLLWTVRRRRHGIIGLLPIPDRRCPP